MANLKLEIAKRVADYIKQGDKKNARRLIFKYYPTIEEGIAGLSKCLNQNQEFEKARLVKSLVAEDSPIDKASADPSNEQQGDMGPRERQGQTPSEPILGDRDLKTTEERSLGNIQAGQEPEINDPSGGEAGAQQPTQGGGSGLGAKIDGAKQMASDYAKKYLSKAAFKAAGSAIWAFIVANIWWILLVLLGILITIGIWSYFTSMRESGASGTTDPRFANSLADDEVITQLLLGANDNQTKTKLSSEVVKDFQNAIANIAKDPDISDEDKKKAEGIIVLLEKISAGEDVQKNIDLLREEVEALTNSHHLVTMCSIGYSSSKASPAGFIQLPDPSDGYRFFSFVNPVAGWARPRVVNAILAVSVRFYLETGKKLVLGDLSHENGGVFGSHNRHEDGTHVDIFSKAFLENSLEELSPEEKIKLGQMLVGCGATTIQYNSPEVISAVNNWAKEKNIVRKDGVSIVRPFAGHDDHFHVHLPLPY